MSVKKESANIFGVHSDQLFLVLYSEWAPGHSR